MRSFETVAGDWKHWACYVSYRLRFQNSMFPISNDCFKTTFFVSKLHFLFPIAFHCFQIMLLISILSSMLSMYSSCSKQFLCFQSTLFPMVVSNLHITRNFLLTLGNWSDCSTMMEKFFFEPWILSSGNESGLFCDNCF